MIKFSQEKVLLLHKLITEETGGDPNVRDIALLNSALESAFQPLTVKSFTPQKKKRALALDTPSFQTMHLLTGTRESECTFF